MKKKGGTHIKLYTVAFTHLIANHKATMWLHLKHNSQTETPVISYLRGGGGRKIVAALPSVGEPFLAWTPAINAMLDSRPIARTACPVFWRKDDKTFSLSLWVQHTSIRTQQREENGKNILFCHTVFCGANHKHINKIIPQWPKHLYSTIHIGQHTQSLNTFHLKSNDLQIVEI